MDGAYYLNAGVLFKVAVTAYERTAAVPSERSGDQNDALVAILFSAATLEAMAMELALLAERQTHLTPNSTLESLSAILKETEDARGSTRLKFLLAKAILTGATYVKGELPYQDFDTLLALRDSIVHLKPESMANPIRVLKGLRAKEICAEKVPNQLTSWLSDIGTRAVARWACNVVANMVDSLRIPALERSPLLGSYIGGRFSHVD